MSKAQLVMEYGPTAARLKISVPDLKGLVRDFQKAAKDKAKEAAAASTIRRRAPALRDIDATIGTMVEEAEIALSSRILNDHRRNIRWCKELGWLNWDTRRWALVDVCVIQGLAEETVRRIYVELANTNPKTQKEEFSYLSNLAKLGSYSARLRGALDYCKSHIIVEVSHPNNQLDTHPSSNQFPERHV